MTITKDHRGAWCISALVKGFLVQRQYLGYTKREATKLFKEETKR
jgi:hypothetical protein